MITSEGKVGGLAKKAACLNTKYPTLNVQESAWHAKFTSDEDNDRICISIPPPKQIHSPLINNQPTIETNVHAMFAGWLLNMNSGGNNKDSVEENHHHPVLKEIRNHLDQQNVIAAGFSYGAATSALASTLRPNHFQCAILLDGWFHLEWSSKWVNIDFPLDASLSEKKRIPRARQPIVVCQFCQVRRIYHTICCHTSIGRADLTKLEWNACVTEYNASKLLWQQQRAIFGAGRWV